MNIIKQCAERATIRARTLLLSRHLNQQQLEFFIVLVCSSVVQAYIAYKQTYVHSRPVEPTVDMLLARVDITELSSRVRMDEELTFKVTREMLPVIMEQLQSAIKGDHAALNLIRNIPEYGNVTARKPN